MPEKPKTFRPCQRVQKRPRDRRPSASARGYGRSWQKASKAYLDAHPLCAECDRQGDLVSATCVDHVIPHKGNMVLFWDSSNWQSLCAHHHSVKTAQDGAFGRRPHE